MFDVPAGLRAALPRFAFDAVEVSGSRVLRTAGQSPDRDMTSVRFRGDFADVARRVAEALGAEPGPTAGNATYRARKFALPDREVTVGVNGAFVEITDWPGARSTRAEVVEVLAGYPWLRAMAERARDGESLTACVVLAEGWRPNAYVEAAGLADDFARTLLREIGGGDEARAESADGARFGTLVHGRLRLGLTPGPL